MHKLNIDGSEFMIPAHWNDFSREQLMFIANLILTKPGIEIQEFKTKVFLQVIDGYVFSYARTPADKHVIVVPGNKLPFTPEQFTACVDLLDFMFSEAEENGQRMLNPTLTINHFKRVQCVCPTVYGPDDALTNIKWEQFMMLQIYQRNMHTEDGLNQFMACIFARRNYEPDLINIRKNADYFAKLSPTVKLITTWFYHGSMAFIVRKFDGVFSTEEDEFDTDSAKQSPFDQQMNLLYVIAKGDVTKYKEIEAEQLYKVLFSMKSVSDADAKLRSEHPEMFK